MQTGPRSARAPSASTQLQRMKHQEKTGHRMKQTLADPDLARELALELERRCDHCGAPPSSECSIECVLRRPPPLYLCQGCGDRFDSESALYVHVAKHSVRDANGNRLLPLRSVEETYERATREPRVDPIDAELDGVLATIAQGWASNLVERHHGSMPAMYAELGAIMGALDILKGAIEFGAELKIEGSSPVLEPVPNKPIRAQLSSPSGARYADVQGAKIEHVLIELARQWSTKPTEQLELELEPPKCAYCGVAFVGKLYGNHIDVAHGAPLCLAFDEPSTRESCMPAGGSEGVARWFLRREQRKASKDGAL